MKLKLLKEILLDTNEKNKIRLENLVQGKSQFFTYNDKITYLDFDDHNNWNNILNLMFSSGYLTIDKEVVEDDFKEVKELIATIMASSLTAPNGDPSFRAVEFRKALAEGNKGKIENIINEMLQSTTYMDSQEYFYHAYLLGIFKSYLDSRYFIVKSNREAGAGRFDVMIEKIDRSIGYIFEFKLANKEEDMESLAASALNQMKEKEYYKELELDKVSEIHEISIVFGKKHC